MKGENSMFKAFWPAMGLFVGLAGAAWADTATPAGSWRTYDDKTGHERSLVRIDITDGVLTGRIVSLVDPAHAADICDKCDDDRKDQTVIGMEIIRGMRQEGDSWTGGRVLDPETGSIYRGTIRLEDGGAAMVLRGYIGIPLLGRSQTWQRAAP
jgi:uncharacterized protein (DUF2147 family)